MRFRKIFTAIAVALPLLSPLSASAQSGPQSDAQPDALKGTEAVLYKTPECGCCDGHAAYLRAAGIKVRVEPRHDLPSIKRRLGVPGELEGCHTTLIEGYVIEGHVPIAPIRRLLAERPAVKGLSLPGMPEGSPGMSGEKRGSFVIRHFGEAGTGVYAVE